MSIKVGGSPNGRGRAVITGCDIYDNGGHGVNVVGDVDLQIHNTRIHNNGGNAINYFNIEFQQFGLKENPPEELVREFLQGATGQKSILGALKKSRLVRWLSDRIKGAINLWTENQAQKFLEVCARFLGM